MKKCSLKGAVKEMRLQETKLISYYKGMGLYFNNYEYILKYGGKMIYTGTDKVEATDQYVKTVSDMLLTTQYRKHELDNHVRGDKRVWVETSVEKLIMSN